MNTYPTLDSAINDFATWRTNKKSKLARMPEHLITIIKQLADIHTPHQLAKALNIKITRVKNIIGIPDDDNLSFVEIPSQSWPDSTVSCVMHRIDGSKLSLEVKVQQLNAIMEAFLCCK